MSSARRSASRRRQAGSTLKNVNLAKVRSAIWVTIAICGFVVGVWAGVGWGSPLNFFGGAEAAARESRPKKYKTFRPPPDPRLDPKAQRKLNPLGWCSCFCRRGRASGSWRGWGCRRGCSARAWARCRRSRRISTSPRATGSSTRSTTRELPPLGRDCSAWTCGGRPGLIPLRPTSSPGCSPRPSKPPESGCRRGSERLVLFRRANLCRPAASPPKKLSGDPRRHPAPDLRSSKWDPASAVVPGSEPARRTTCSSPSGEAAAGRKRGAGDRHRRPRLRRKPDLGQHPPRRLRALHRHRADDPRSARGSPCPRRSRASRSAARAASTRPRSSRWGGGWR